MAPKPAAALAQRIRQARLEAGLAVKTAAATAGVSTTTWGHWEHGRKQPFLGRGAAIASALGIPVRALFDSEGETTLLEVTLSAESLARVKREGKPAAQEIASRFAAILEAEILREAMHPPINEKQGRGKRRRTREEILAGIAEAKAMSLARKQRRFEGRAGDAGEALTAR